MNLNNLIINRTRGRGKKNAGRNLLAIDLNSPSVSTEPPTKKNSTPSSDLNWGESHVSVPITSSTSHKSVDSSRVTSDEDSRVIVALTEGRGEARCEVGMAAINVSRPHLILCQVSDTESYINTLTKINIFNPDEIVVPITFIEKSSENRLLDIIKQQFPNIKYTGIPRSMFSKDAGKEILSKLCISNLNAVLLVLQDRYYAVAASSGLISYIQNNLFIYYAAGSIKIDYHKSDEYAIIDVTSADRLELVCCTKPTQGNKYSSLFGVLNHCQTRIGKRTLRASILQPPFKVEYIQQRLNCVAELKKHPEALLSIQVLLQKIANVDMLLGLSTIIPLDPQECSNRQLNYILLLNTLLDLVNPLKDVLSKFNQPFFTQLKTTLESEEIVLIKEIVSNTIQEGTHPAKGEAGIMQRCFAIKPGINGLLDLVRKTYSERIDDMREYVKMLATKHNLPLTLGNNQAKGHHIILKLNQHQKKHLKKSDLPDEFILVRRLAGSFTMKTAELTNLSTRIDHIMNDILSISNIMVHSILEEIKKYASLFYKLCEEIAHLDVLQSLAEASARNGYVKPTFGDFTEVTFAHHPLLDFLLPKKPISNNISSSSDFNVHIITGPNGSGKSIFVKQVVLLQVMAQLGCHVPAKTAIFRPADRMYARISLEDNVEYGVSSFMLEMKEVNYIMNSVTENSLVIIDELCRSTSVEEGTALAIAIIERLAQLSAFTYVTTHNTMLTKLHELYLNVKVWQMETISSGKDPKSFQLDFRYNLLPGVTPVRFYGVYVVRNIWPDSILDDIYEVLDKLTKMPQNVKLIPIDEKVRLKYTVEAEFRKLKAQKKLTIAEINKILNQYQNALQKLGHTIHSIDVAPSTDLLENVQENMPQIWHSVFENSGSLREQSGDCIEEDFQTISEKMKQVFIPKQTLFNDPSIGIENRRTTQQINEIFTPESLQPSQQSMSSVNIPMNSFQMIPNQEAFIQTEDAYSNNSHYRNISNFIEENSENINKLVPQINLSYKEMLSVSQSSSDLAQNVFGLFGTDFVRPTDGNETLFNFQSTSEPSQTRQFHNSSEKSSSIDVSEDMNQFRFSVPLCNDVSRTSTPIVQGAPFQNFSRRFHHAENDLQLKQLNKLDNIDLESIREDLEICSRTFTEEDDFEATMLSSTEKLLPESKQSNVAKKNPVADKVTYQHLMPKVIVIEGPNNTTLSFDGNDDISEEQRSLMQKKEDDAAFAEGDSANKYVAEERTETEQNIVEDAFQNSTNFINSYNSEGTDEGERTNCFKMIEDTSVASPNPQIDNDSRPSIAYEPREKPKAAENVSSCDVNKTVATSISAASKLRNLEQVTSGSSPQEEETSDKKTCDKSTTSISSASKKRNLDQAPTQESNSNETLNQTSVCRTSEKSETTSSAKESDYGGKANKAKALKPRGNQKKDEDGRKRPKTGGAIRRRFVPPRKLTAKEIREEFREQDRKLLESNPGSSGFTKYLEQVIRRPSVKQIQSATHVAYFTRTEEGIEVIPAQPAKKTRKQSPLRRNLSSDTFSASIVSDKNAAIFDSYLNSKEKDYKTFYANFRKNQQANSNFGNEKWEFEEAIESHGDYTNDTVTSHFVRRNSEIVADQSQTNNQPVFTPRMGQICMPFTQQSIHALTPDGFYKDNKEDIVRTMNKYLSSGTADNTQDSRPTGSRHIMRSIFDNGDIDASDLDI